MGTLKVTITFEKVTITAEKVTIRIGKVTIQTIISSLSRSRNPPLSIGVQASPQSGLDENNP